MLGNGFSNADGMAAVEELGEALEVLQEYHLDVARSIWPRGATLVCPRCGRVQTATASQLATHLGRGWPTCCRGTTMHVGDVETN